MKKIYAIAAAVLLCGSATAAGRHQMVEGADLLLKASKIEKSTNISAIKSESPLKARAKKMASPMKANNRTSVADYAGTYTLSCTSLIQLATPTYWTVTVANEATGELAMTFELDKAYTIKAFVDVATGTFTIPNDQALGKDTAGDSNWFYLKDVDMSTGQIAAGKSAAASTVGTVDGNKITFPEMDIWVVGDYNNEDLGYWMATYNNMFKIPAVGNADSSLADFIGVYQLQAQSITQGGYITEWEASVNDEATGEIALEIALNGVIWTMKAFVNVAEGTFSIPNNQYLGKDSYGDSNWFYLKEPTADGSDIQDGMSEMAATVGVINGNVITFPELDIWAIGDPNDEGLGWWMMTFMNSFIIPGGGGGNNDEGWTDFATATFEDAWLIPAYGYESSQYPWTVTVQQNDNDANLYRLNSPYTASDCPVSEGCEQGYIVFDLSEPNFVKVFPDYYSGVKNSSTKLYFFNIEGLYSAQGYTSDEIIQGLSGQLQDFSTFNNGVVTIKNARFDIKTPCTSPYVWSDEYDQTLESLMHGKIIFDSSNVSTIAADAVEGVEFYNLQGQRVMNPEAGQLVIKRTANGAIKTIIR